MARTEEELKPFDAPDLCEHDDDELSMPTLVLVATLTAATVAQGTFAGPSRWLVGVGIVTVAVLGIEHVSRLRVGRLGMALGALATWILIRGATSDAMTSALWQLGLIVALGVTAMTVSGARRVEREAVLTAVVMIGIGVAISGWLGAAFRVEPWGNPGPTTWRASSFLTYPNAAAAVMAMSIMVMLARGCARSLGRVDTAMITVLLAGVISTQSRGGALAALAGLTVFTMLQGVTRTVRLLVAPVIGAVVAAAIALPSMVTSSEASPARVVLGLCVGVVVAVAVGAVAERSARWLTFGVVAVPAAVVLAVVHRDRFETVASDRLQLASGDRANTTREALNVLEANPIAGVGPGNVNLVWQFDDRFVTTRFVHNEYLQLAAELGVVGAVLLGAVVMAGAAALWRARLAHGDAPLPPGWVAGVSALAAVGVHSAFDFLWHIPAIPLVAAAIFGCAVTRDDAAATHPPIPVDSLHAVDTSKGSPHEEA